jgi:hypothetical protein
MCLLDRTLDSVQKRKAKEWAEEKKKETETDRCESKAYHNEAAFKVQTEIS